MDGKNPPKIVIRTPCPWDPSLEWDTLSCIIEPQNDAGGLYLGDYDAALDMNLLKKLKIRAVLTVCKEVVARYKRNGHIIYHKIISADDD